MEGKAIVLTRVAKLSPKQEFQSMCLPRLRFTLFQIMVTVAITGLAMGYAVHARNILHDEGDFGTGILLVECIVMLMLSVFAIPIILAIYLAIQNEDYSDRRMRNEMPGDVQFMVADESSPEPQSL